VEKEPPILRTGETKLAPTARRARSASFPERVKKTYEYKCAVCGSFRKNACGQPEVEAAHIYPKEENGADDIRNGIALCSFHHWAFDGGLFLIDQNLTIRLTEPGDQIGELVPLDGRMLAILPPRNDDRPHTLYIKARLKMPRFSSLGSKGR